MRRIHVALTDTLAFFRPALGTYTFDPKQSRTSTWWFKVPAGWLGKGGLRETRREDVLRLIYGPAWRSGNTDGSRYQVLDLAARAPTRTESRTRAWREAPCYVWTGDAFEEVSPKKF